MIKLELEKILDPDNISQDPKVLDSYQSDMSFTNPIRPEYIVKPRDVDEIKSLIGLANNTRTPLIPVSSGSPHFKGDTVPGCRGAIIVDLSGMKKIINVDRNYRVAMCETGVTFNELIPAVNREGLRLNIPLLPKQSKSVVSSILEREPVTMPTYHWDISDPLNCIEVVFGSGEIFRTGSAAGPGTIEEQWLAGQAQNEAAGPTQASLHRTVQGAQGTLGIVTWASLRCEIIPRLEEPFIIGSSQLDKLIDIIYWLIRLRLVNECFILNNSNLATILKGEYSSDYEKIKESLPPWVLFFNIAGYDYLPEERINYLKNEVNKIARKVGVEPVKTIGTANANDILKIVQRPSGDSYWKLNNRGAFEDIFFITLYDKIDGLIKSMYAGAESEGLPVSNIGIYLQPIVQGVNCHCEFSLFYDPQNATEVEKVKKLSAPAIKELFDRGAYFSRPYGENAKEIFKRDAATTQALKKVKTIFDPNNVMNPGKLCF